MKATLPNGSLRPIDDCYIYVPELSDEIVMKILPDISDTKSTTYSDEPAIGRSFPIKNYSQSDNRSISWTIHMMVCREGDREEIIQAMKLLEACVYPTRQETPYAPPPICQIKCGRLLTDDDQPLCCVLKNYSVKFPTDVAWDEEGYVPYKLDIDLTFEAVYDSKNLPYAEDIQLLGTSMGF